MTQPSEAQQAVLTDLDEGGVLKRPDGTCFATMRRGSWPLRRVGEATLAALEKRGWVTRHRSSDWVFWTISDAGRAACRD